MKNHYFYYSTSLKSLEILFSFIKFISIPCRRLRFLCCQPCCMCCYTLYAYCQIVNFGDGERIVVMSAITVFHDVLVSLRIKKTNIYLLSVVQLQLALLN